MTASEQFAALALRESMRVNGHPLINPTGYELDYYEDEKPKSRGLQFNKNIDLGHLLSVLLMLAALSFQWNLMDKRVAVLEEARNSQREREQTQAAMTKEKFQEVRDALAGLTRSVEKVADKLEQRK